MAPIPQELWLKSIVGFNLLELIWQKPNYVICM